jgi:hypothetical protein
MEIRKGLLFKDLHTLRRWLQEYSVKRKRPFKVRHSYVERRYIFILVYRCPHMLVQVLCIFSYVLNYFGSL